MSISPLSTMLILLGLVGACGSASAREVFRTEDENGVVSFSDVASAEAEVIVLESDTARPDSFDRQREIIEQQLAVAKSLEESRLAREEARTRRIEALAAARPPTYEPQPVRRTYVGGIGYWRPVHPWHPGKPSHPGWRPPHPGLPIEPPPGGGNWGGGRLDPPSRPVPLPPLKPR